jgi:hypothetical protein
VPRHAVSPARRSAAPRLAVAAIALVAVAVGGLVVANRPAPGEEAAQERGDVAAIPVVERPARPTGAGTPVLEVQAPSPPVRVVIPAIGVTSPLESLDLGGDGELTAPDDYRSAGWFAAGTQPGQPGPAVIAGHVDSPDGPAVFARLQELEPGDEVQVVREDGSEVRFRVSELETAPKDAFPTASVYGPVPGPELRLITCDGLFDRSTGHYVDNLIVYAVATSTPALTP